MDFKTDFSHLLSLTRLSASVMRKDCFDMHKVKVIVEGQRIKLTLSEEQLLHLSMDFKIISHTCSPLQVLVSCEKFCFGMPKVNITIEGQMFKLTLYKA